MSATETLAGAVDLEARVEELLAENDRMSFQLWARDVALRVLAERVVELEGGDE